MPFQIYPGQISKAIVIELPEDSGSNKGVKVRIPEFHGPCQKPSEDEDILYVEDEYLPYADVCIPLGSYGSALTVNEVVYVTYPDRKIQLPMIIGTTGVVLGEDMTGKNATGYRTYGTNSYADTEGGDWYPTDGSKDLVGFAASQVGSDGTNSWRYWYGNTGQKNHWCAMFVSYCAANCGYIASDPMSINIDTNPFGNDGVIPKFAECGRGARAFDNKGLFKYSSSGYIPNPGDIIFFKWKGNGHYNLWLDNPDRSDITKGLGVDHVGIVRSANINQVRVIHGNTQGTGEGATWYLSSKVADVVFSRTSPEIIGYGTPVYPSNYSVEVIPDEGSLYSTLQIIYDVLRHYNFSNLAFAGIAGNWYAESKIRSLRMEGDYLGGFSWSQVLYNNGKINQVGVNEFCNSILKPTYDRQGLAIKINTYKPYNNVDWYPGIGLGQWTGTRNRELQQFSIANNMLWSDVGTQLAYMLTSPGTSHGDSGKPTLMRYLNNTIGSSNKDRIAKYTTPEEAAYKFFAYWESGRGDSLSIESFNNSTSAKRAVDARRIYNLVPGLSEGQYKGPGHDELVDEIISSIII